MKKIFAVPTLNKKLSSHFGHCEQFALLETENNEIINIQFIDPPAHQPGSYPKFLAGKGVNTIIAGGMGMKAHEIFAQNNIEVLMGIHEEDPELLVKQYLEDQLVSGENMCDH